MDSLPPNDPHRNNDGNFNNGHPSAPKEAPPARGGGRQQRNDAGLNERGEMELFGGGNLGDDTMIAAMVLIGVAAFLLREICVC
jgi:hypothetical protein